MALVIDDEYIADKVDAYNIAIECLRDHESESDTAGSRAMRLKLAGRLDREIQRWVNSHTERS